PLRDRAGSAEDRRFRCGNRRAHRRGVHLRSARAGRACHRLGHTHTAVPAGEQATAEHRARGCRGQTHAGGGLNMTMAANILIGIVALLHAWFLVLEMFLWDKPLGRKVFRVSAEQAAATKTLAVNQGLYNGFLVAGLVWG